MGSPSENPYEKPDVEEFGSIEDVTQTFGWGGKKKKKGDETSPGLGGGHKWHK